MIDKTLHRKLMLEQQDPHKNNGFELRCSVRDISSSVTNPLISHECRKRTIYILYLYYTMPNLDLYLSTISKTAREQVSHIISREWFVCLISVRRY